MGSKRIGYGSAGSTGFRLSGGVRIWHSRQESPEPSEMMPMFPGLGRQVALGESHVEVPTWHVLSGRREEQFGKVYC